MSTGIILAAVVIGLGGFTLGFSVSLYVFNRQIDRIIKEEIKKQLKYYSE